MTDTKTNLPPFFAVLISEGLEDLEAFNSEKKAKAFADDRNKDFIDEYDSLEEYYDDACSLEWIIITSDELARNFEEEYERYKEFPRCYSNYIDNE